MQGLLKATSCRHVAYKGGLEGQHIGEGGWQGGCVWIVSVGGPLALNVSPHVTSARLRIKNTVKKSCLIIKC